MPRHKWTGLGKRPKTRSHDATRHKPGCWYEYFFRCDKCPNTFFSKGTVARLPSSWHMDERGNVFCAMHK
jgi:hypothetical protein